MKGDFSIFHTGNFLPFHTVTNNNFECLRYDYLLYLMRTRLIYYFCRSFDLEYSRYFVSSIFYCLLLVTGIISCLHVLIAIFRLEVCDVTIMLGLCFRNRVYFSTVTFHGLFWDIR